MEVNKFGVLKTLFLKEVKPFTKKRDLHYKRLFISGVVFGIVLVVGILSAPIPEKEETTFHEKGENTQTGTQSITENGLTQDTLVQLQQSNLSVTREMKSYDYLNQRGGIGISNQNHNSSMILNRDGIDSKIKSLLVHEF